VIEKPGFLKKHGFWSILHNCNLFIIPDSELLTPARDGGVRRSSILIRSQNFRSDAPERRSWGYDPSATLGPDLVLVTPARDRYGASL
jgi:hypothetical protein